MSKKKSIKKAKDKQELTAAPTYTPEEVLLMVKAEEDRRNNAKELRREAEKEKVEIAIAQDMGMSLAEFRHLMQVQEKLKEEFEKAQKEELEKAKRAKVTKVVAEYQAKKEAEAKREAEELAQQNKKDEQDQEDDLKEEDGDEGGDSDEEGFVYVPHAIVAAVDTIENGGDYVNASVLNDVGDLTTVVGEVAPSSMWGVFGGGASDK